MLTCQLLVTRARGRSVSARRCEAALPSSTQLNRQPLVALACERRECA